MSNRTELEFGVDSELISKGPEVINDFDSSQALTVPAKTKRKLASIQKVLALEPIEGADKIEKATVLGWNLVVKKGEFQVGSLCLYLEVDSIVPDQPHFEFLRDRHFRIKTIRLRKQISQGIAFPLDILPEIQYAQLIQADPESIVGTDVTEMLGIKKFELEVPAQLRGLIKGNFPEFLHKTDETRIQSEPQVLERYRGKQFYIAEKVDGSSMTVYLRDGEFGVCSRNLDLKEEEANAYWKKALELDLKGRLTALGGNFALQGELVGPGIQGNKYRLDGVRFFVFNVFDINRDKCLDSQDFIRTVKEMGLETVPVLETHHTLTEDVPALVALSNAPSVLNPEVLREGIVFRPIYEAFDKDLGRLSFKVINPEFLLLHDDE